MTTPAMTTRASSAGAREYPGPGGADAATGAFRGVVRTKGSAPSPRRDGQGPFLTLLPPVVYTWNRRQAWRT